MPAGWSATQAQDLKGLNDAFLDHVKQQVRWLLIIYDSLT